MTTCADGNFYQNKAMPLTLARNNHVTPSPPPKNIVLYQHDQPIFGKFIMHIIDNKNDSSSTIKTSAKP
jgi:hypothetical protein